MALEKWMFGASGMLHDGSYILLLVKQVLNWFSLAASGMTPCHWVYKQKHYTIYIILRTFRALMRTLEHTHTHTHTTRYAAHTTSLK